MSAVKWSLALFTGVSIIAASAVYVGSGMKASSFIDCDGYSSYCAKTPTVQYHIAPPEYIARASDFHREMLGIRVGSR